MCRNCIMQIVSDHLDHDLDHVDDDLDHLDKWSRSSRSRSRSSTVDSMFAVMRCRSCIIQIMCSMTPPGSHALLIVGAQRAHQGSISSERFRSSNRDLMWHTNPKCRIILSQHANTLRTYARWRGSCFFGGAAAVVDRPLYFFARRCEFNSAMGEHAPSLRCC